MRKFLLTLLALAMPAFPQWGNHVTSTHVISVLNNDWSAIAKLMPGIFTPSPRPSLTVQIVSKGDVPSSTSHVYAVVFLGVDGKAYTVQGTAQKLGSSPAASVASPSTKVWPATIITACAGDVGEDGPPSVLECALEVIKQE